MAGDRSAALGAPGVAGVGAVVWEFDVRKTAVKNAERPVVALGGDIV